MRPTKATWTSADGTTRRIVDMTDEHLENTINWLKRHELGGHYGAATRRAQRLLSKLPILKKERERRRNVWNKQDFDAVEYILAACRMIELHDELFGPIPMRIEYDQIISMSTADVIRAMNAGLRITIGAKVRQSLMPRYPLRRY